MIAGSNSNQYNGNVNAMEQSIYGKILSNTPKGIINK
jgi:hypothetical protein